MKILVLGAGGMLGHKIYQRLKNTSAQVYASFRKPKSYYRDLGVFEMDDCIDRVNVLNTGNFTARLNALEPDVIVNCIGVTTRKVESSGDEEVIHINALLPHQLATWCREHQSRLIHFSTDCVFSGKSSGGYTEESVTDAMDVYGRSKALGEVAGPESITLRSSIIGREISHFTELVEWFIGQAGGKAKGFSQVYYTGVTTNFMAEVVEQVIFEHPKLHGIHQLASPKISKFELLKLINEKLNLGIELSEVALPASDKSLNGDRFFKTTGIQTPTWDEMIEVFKQEHDMYTKRRVA